MAYQFQQPGFVHAQDYSYLPKSIDDLFTAYSQGKVRAAQQQTAELQPQVLQAQLAAAQQNNAAGLAQFQLQNGGLTPQQVSQYLPQAMATPQGPGMVPSQPTPLLPQQQSPLQQIQQGPIVPQGPQMQPAQEDPGLATVRHILEMHQQSLQLGAAQQVAGLQKTQAEAQKAGAEAGLTEAQVKLLGGNDAIVGNIVNQIKNGKMTVDDLSNLGRGDVANAIKVGVSSQLAAQGVDINSLNNQQSKNKATADLQGQRGKVVDASASVLEDILNKAEPLVQKLSPSQVSAINDAYAKGLRSVRNDPTATKFLTYMAEAKGKYKQVLSLGNAPSDQDEKSADETIRGGLTPQSFAAMKEAILTVSGSTRGHLLGNGQSPAPAQNPQQMPSQPSFASNPQALKIKADYQAGRISREQARAALGALGGLAR